MSTIAERVIKIVAEQLGVKEEEVTREKSFADDLGADELSIREILKAVEDEFDLKITRDGDDLDQTLSEDEARLSTVQAVIGYVNEHKA
ncbi:acyl carrier protein [Kitasatospora griseola]|uniref:acyl carrier protein n=1 Tax=Kitasatospora griseola TaxID=2064 RepID=UPI003855EB12|nr:acyl carrier protein [Kitasatospora purpeofusca]